MPATSAHTPENRHLVANVQLTLDVRNTVAPGEHTIFDQLERVNVEVQTGTELWQTESRFAAFGAEGTAKRPQTYNDRAVQLLHEYMQWYRKYVDIVERNLQVAGTPKPRRMGYAREQGLRKLAGLAELINVRSYRQLSTIAELLEGFQELGALSAIPEDQVVFLIRAVEDVIVRLNKLGLLKQRSSGPEIRMRRSSQVGPVAA